MSGAGVAVAGEARRGMREGRGQGWGRGQMRDG